MAIIQRLASLGLFTAALLAACASPATPDPNVRGAPTLPPPPWVESADTVSLDTVSQVRYLGRLDSAAAPSTIFAHALSPDGTRLAALDTELILVWDLISGELVFSTGRGDANQIFYAPDKTEVYTVTPGGKVTIYDAESGVVQNTFDGISNFNGALAFHAEDGWLALGNQDGQVKVWDPVERQAIVTIDAHPLQLIALAFSPDGEYLVSAAEDRIVNVWDWRSKQRTASFEVNDVPHLLRFSPDATQIAAASAEQIALLSLTDGTVSRIIDTGTGGTDILLYAPDGRHLLSGGALQEMTLWNPQTGGLVARLPDSGGDRISAAFSPDGSLLLTSEMGGPASLWNMTTITDRTLNRADLSNPAPVFGVDWTSDSRLLTLFGATGAVYVWGVGEAAE